MSDDLRSATEAWLMAKKALSDAQTALSAAIAGHEVATRCEAEAWAAIAGICGRPATAPSAAAPANVPSPATGAAFTAVPFATAQFGSQHPLVSTIHYGSNGFYR